MRPDGPRWVDDVRAAAGSAVLVRFADGLEWRLAELEEAARRSRVGPGLVFLATRADPETLAAFWAARDVGAALALFDADLAPELFEALVARFAPQTIIGWKSPLAGYETEGSTSTRLATPTPVHPGLRLLLSTSGTTGSPKLVRLDERALRENARSIAAALAITPEQRGALTLPIHYAYGLSVLASHWAVGASVAFIPSGPLAAEHWATIEAAGCTSIPGVPYTWDLALKLRVPLPPRVRTLTQAGGRLRPETVRAWAEQLKARSGAFFVMYGQTEATARISVLPPEESFVRPGSIGRAIPGGLLRLDQGELVYEGPNVMWGSGETAAELALGDVLGGVLRTGDLGEVDPEGFFSITGRLNRFAKLVGVRINLDDVERFFAARGSGAAVSNDQRLTVYCTWGSAAELESARAELASHLRLHPSLIVMERLEELPMLSSGKVDYRALLGGR